MSRRASETFLYDHELDAIPTEAGPMVPPPSEPFPEAREPGGKLVFITGPGRLAAWWERLDLAGVIGIGLMSGYFLVTLAMVVLEPTADGIALSLGPPLCVLVLCWLRPRWSALGPGTAVAARRLAVATGKVASATAVAAEAIRTRPPRPVMGGVLALLALLIGAGMVARIQARQPVRPVVLPRPPAPPAVIRPVLQVAGRSRVQDRHRARRAIVYVRETAGDGRPTWRELVDQAVALGWPEDRVVRIDAPWFDRLLAEVCEGGVGLVLCRDLREAALSPARSAPSEDWNFLLDVCGLVDTLLGEQGRVYDLDDYDTRFWLGYGRMGREPLDGVSQPPVRARLDDPAFRKLAFLEPVVARLARSKATDDRAERRWKDADTLRASLAARLARSDAQRKWRDGAAARR